MGAVEAGAEDDRTKLGVHDPLAEEPGHPVQEVLDAAAGEPALGAVENQDA
jgi:hypothetical protein